MFGSWFRADSLQRTNGKVGSTFQNKLKCVLTKPQYTIVVSIFFSITPKLTPNIMYQKVKCKCGNPEHVTGKTWPWKQLPNKGFRA